MFVHPPEIHHATIGPNGALDAPRTTVVSRQRNVPVFVVLAVEILQMPRRCARGLDRIHALVYPGVGIQAVGPPRSAHELPHAHRARRAARLGSKPTFYNRKVLQLVGDTFFLQNLLDRWKVGFRPTHPADQMIAPLLQKPVAQLLYALVLGHGHRRLYRLRARRGSRGSRQRVFHPVQHLEYVLPQCEYAAILLLHVLPVVKVMFGHDGAKQLAEAHIVRDGRLVRQSFDFRQRNAQNPRPLRNIPRGLRHQKARLVAVQPAEAPGQLVIAQGVR